jgi:hypothetical protein
MKERVSDVGVILSATPAPLQFNKAGGIGGETLEDNAASGNVLGRSELA